MITAPPDTLPPVVTNVAATPPSQVSGGTVVISADVVDGDAVATVSVNVTLPAGGFANRTMANVGGSQYAHSGTWTQVGLHAIRIWASDPSGNWASATGAFSITAPPDTTRPTIANVAAAPSPQAAGGIVTVSARVTDDRSVASVSVNVTQPDASTANSSMQAQGGDVWALARSWSQVGVHAFVIWASDPSGNWASATGAFTITAPPDTAPPRIEHTPPPGPLRTGDAIPIEATVTDASAIFEVRIRWTDVHGDVRNVTMAREGGVYAYVIPGQSAAGNVTYEIYAVDEAGNGATVGPFTLSVEVRPVTPLGLEVILVPMFVGLLAAFAVGTIAYVLFVRRRREEPPPEEPPEDPDAE